MSQAGRAVTFICAWILAARVVARQKQIALAGSSGFGSWHSDAPSDDGMTRSASALGWLALGAVSTATLEATWLAHEHLAEEPLGDLRTTLRRLSGRTLHSRPASFPGCESGTLLHRATPTDQELAAELQGLLHNLTAPLPEGYTKLPAWPKLPRGSEKVGGLRNPRAFVWPAPATQPICA